MNMEPINSQLPGQTPIEPITEAHEIGVELAPTSEDYAARVDDMYGMLFRESQSSGYEVAIGNVWAEYVDNESNPIWQQFCSVMLRGPQMAANIEARDEYEAAEKVRRLTTDEYNIFHSLKHQIIEDGHYFRSMLEYQRNNFTIKEVAAWHAKFRGCTQEKAEGYVVGIMAEIALFEAAATMPGLLMAVEYGTPEEDSHGGDVKALTTDTLEEVMIDAKAGMQAPEVRRAKTGYKVVVGVPTQLLDKHGRVDEDGASRLRQLIALTMQQAVALKKTQ